jgi:hypothetical protein
MCAPAAGRKLWRLRGLASASNRLAAARLACTACHTVRQRHSSAASTIAAMMPVQRSQAPDLNQLSRDTGMLSSLTGDNSPVPCKISDELQFPKPLPLEQHAE